ncbi:hypothetical protein YC2023_009186 [Brassica napus]
MKKLDEEEERVVDAEIERHIVDAAFTGDRDDGLPPKTTAELRSHTPDLPLLPNRCSLSSAFHAAS